MPAFLFKRKYTPIIYTFAHRVKEQMQKSTPSILFILPYPVGKAPSQRFRVEQFLPLLDENKIPYLLACFMDAPTWDILYSKSSVFQKVWGITKGYFKRWKHVLIDVHRYNVVFVHREAAPLGPPLFEWIVSKLWRKKLIYDFDDAIWIPNTSNENKLVSYFKSFWKVAEICKWSATVTAGNHYLANFARQNGAQNVIYLPTVVDAENRYVPKPAPGGNNLPVVGWTGSHSTLKYLEALVPVLQKLEKDFEFTFLVIANKNPELPLKNFKFLQWNETSEIEDLRQIDIGVMPLTADPWSEGKCGFKLIQYMALGIPSVASPVGVNKEIIQDGANGFLAQNAGEWQEKLSLLLQDPLLRASIGKAGIATISEFYSLRSQEEKFLKLFQR